MVAISLNIQQRVHPVIWSVTNLPYDALQAVPINKPIGGCLILCTNSLIYLNQSVPSYGVSLNSTADHSTNFPLKPQDGVKISLDSAQIAFITNEKLVLSLKDGELYVLSLLADSMRSVRSFHFSRAASSVLTSCVSKQILAKLLIDSDAKKSRRSACARRNICSSARASAILSSCASRRKTTTW